mgnify:CR=1 FL=1
MKKVFYFSLMVMTMFLMTACSSSGPGDAMKKYGNYLIKGDYEKFVDGLAFDESVGAEKMKEQKDGLVSMLKEKEKYRDHIRRNIGRWKHRNRKD